MICPPSGDDEGLSPSGEGRRSVSPSDPVETLNAFTRKVGAFVNKPSTQVTSETRFSVLVFTVGVISCSSLKHLSVCR